MAIRWLAVKRIEKNCRASDSLIRLDGEVAVLIFGRWGCDLEVGCLPGRHDVPRRRREKANDYKAAMTLVMGCKSDY